jgi:hypothetical protein
MIWIAMPAGEKSYATRLACPRLVSAESLHCDSSSRESYEFA